MNALIKKICAFGFRDVRLHSYGEIFWAYALHVDEECQDLPQGSPRAAAGNDPEMAIEALCESMTAAGLIK